MPLFFCTENVVCQVADKDRFLSAVVSAYYVCCKYSNALNNTFEWWENAFKMDNEILPEISKTKMSNIKKPLAHQSILLSSAPITC